MNHHKRICPLLSVLLLLWVAVSFSACAVLPDEQPSAPSSTLSVSEYPPNTQDETVEETPYDNSKEDVLSVLESTEDELSASISSSEQEGDTDHEYSLETLFDYSVYIDGSADLSVPEGPLEITKEDGDSVKVWYSNGAAFSPCGMHPGDLYSYDFDHMRFYLDSHKTVNGMPVVKTMCTHADLDRLNKELEWLCNAVASLRESGKIMIETPEKAISLVMQTQGRTGGEVFLSNTGQHYVVWTDPETHRQIYYSYSPSMHCYSAFEQQNTEYLFFTVYERTNPAELLRAGQIEEQPNNISETWAVTLDGQCFHALVPDTLS